VHRSKIDRAPTGVLEHVLACTARVVMFARYPPPQSRSSATLADNLDAVIPCLCLRIRQRHQLLEICRVVVEVSLAQPMRAPTVALQRTIRFPVANLHCRIIKIRRGGDQDGHSDGAVPFIALVHAQLATVDLSCAANAN
jgi:hypothetical protein